MALKRTRNVTHGVPTARSCIHLQCIIRRWFPLAMKRRLLSHHNIALWIYAYFLLESTSETKSKFLNSLPRLTATYIQGCHQRGNFHKMWKFCGCCGNFCGSLIFMEILGGWKQISDNIEIFHFSFLFLSFHRMFSLMMPRIGSQKKHLRIRSSFYLDWHISLINKRGTE